MKVKYLGDGGYEYREPRTSSVYEDRRANLAATNRARAYAGDIMEEVREVFVRAPPVTQENRDHRADQQRHFPRRPADAACQVLILLSKFVARSKVHMLNILSCMTKNRRAQERTSNNLLPFS